MPDVERKDSVLWFKHLPVGPLRTRLEALSPGEQVTLLLDGQPSQWQRMATGRDGRPTNGAKPLGPAKERWNGTPRGSWVAVELPDLRDEASGVEPDAVSASTEVIVRVEASPDPGRAAVVIGCDVGTSEKDPHTGLIVLRDAPDRPLELLRDPQNVSPERALEVLPQRVRQYDAKVVVLDAPLLPTPGDAPPPANPGCYRPNESMINGPRRPAIERAVAEYGPDDRPAYTTAERFLNRMRPFSTATGGRTQLARRLRQRPGREAVGSPAADHRVRLPARRHPRRFPQGVLLAAGRPPLGPGIPLGKHGSRAAKRGRRGRTRAPPRAGASGAILDPRRARLHTHGRGPGRALGSGDAGP